MNEQIPVNSRVSHYRILSKIGAGGMGEVYLALGKPTVIELPKMVIRTRTSKEGRFTPAVIPTIQSG